MSDAKNRAPQAPAVKQPQLMREKGLSSDTHQRLRNFLRAALVIRTNHKTIGTRLYIPLLCVTVSPGRNDRSSPLRDYLISAAPIVGLGPDQYPTALSHILACKEKRFEL